MTFSTKLLIIVVIIITGLNIFSLKKINNLTDLTKGLQNEQQGLADQKKYQQSIMEQSIINRLQFDDATIIQNSSITDDSGSNYNISDHKEKIVFRFFEQDCYRCLTEFSKVLDTFSVKHHIPYVLVENYSTTANMKIFKSFSNTKQTIYKCDSLVSHEDRNNPMLFVMDKNNRVEAVFFPQEGMYEFEKKYLNEILNIYSFK